MLLSPYSFSVNRKNKKTPEAFKVSEVSLTLKVDAYIITI